MFLMLHKTISRTLKPVLFVCTLVINNRNLFSSNFLFFYNFFFGFSFFFLLFYLIFSTTLSIFIFPFLELPFGNSYFYTLTFFFHFFSSLQRQLFLFSYPHAILYNLIDFLSTLENKMSQLLSH